MSNGTPGDEEKMKRAAHGALLLLIDNLPANCKLSVEDVDEVVITGLQRHGEHLTTHAINQTHLDPIKLICWLGHAVVERLDKDVSFYQHETVILAVLTTLEQILAFETRMQIRVLKNDKELIKRLLMQEIKGNGPHGIGFNGLFIAFHCYRSSYEQVSAKAKN